MFFQNKKKGSFNLIKNFTSKITKIIESLILKVFKRKTAEKIIRKGHKKGFLSYSKDKSLAIVLFLMGFVLVISIWFIVAIR